MPTWIFTVAFTALALILITGLFLLSRQRKKARLELRLLAGRRQLLGRELEACLAELQEVDDEAIAALRQEAEGALDQLHVALVERQAHLLNYEDMAHLQQCKIELLATPPPPAVEPEPKRPRRSAPRAEPPKPQSDDKQDRSSLESDLLSKISQLQDGKKKPKK